MRSFPPLLLPASMNIMSRKSLADFPKPRGHPYEKKQRDHAPVLAMVLSKPRNGQSHDRPGAEPRSVGRNCGGHFALGFALVRQFICCFRVVFKGGLLIWAVDGVFRGVNPWRRCLGAAVLGYEL